MTTSAIEQQHQFIYPELYKQLAHDGMLDVGEYGSDWMTTVFPRLREQPTLLLFSDDFELLTLEHANEVTEALIEPDDYRDIKPEYQFIALAQNGAGDYYCFFPTAQQGDDMPIVFLWHDVNEAIYLAKNLQDFIFRRILTDMANQDTFNQVGDDEFRQNIRATLKTHSAYLTERQRETVATIAQREITTYEAPAGNRLELRRGLLTSEELTDILAATIPFAQLNTSFAYSNG